MNVLDYLRQAWDSFDKRPFGALDAAALSQIAMLKADGLIAPLKERSGFPASAADATVTSTTDKAPDQPVPPTALLRAERYPTMLAGRQPWGPRELNLYGVAASPRLRGLTLDDYLSIFDPVNEIQFAALTFTAPDFGVVAFRGTDSTLTGWKEDCNMSFAAPVPAQAQAQRYLEVVARRLPEKLYIVGHSKGGNLAEYATLKASPAVQARIVNTYNLDGPGFKEGTFTKADYAPVIDRIVKIVPVDSIVGLLLHSPVPLKVVASDGKGFGEHSVFTWQLDAQNGKDFHTVPSLSSDASFAAQVIGQWLSSIDDAKREALVEAIFRLLGSSASLTQIFTTGLPAVGSLLQKDAPTDPRDVATVIAAGKSLADAAAAVAQATLKKPPTSSQS